MGWENNRHEFVNFDEIFVPNTTRPVVNKLDFESTLEREGFVYSRHVQWPFINRIMFATLCLSAQENPLTGHTSDARQKPHCWTGQLSLAVESASLS